MAATARSLPLSSSRPCSSSIGIPAKISVARWPSAGRIRAKSGAEETEPEKKNNNSLQSIFNNVTEALDFSQVRSEDDAVLLDEARQATKSGGRMSKEQVNIKKSHFPFSSSFEEVNFVHVLLVWSPEEEDRGNLQRFLQVLR